MILGYTTRYGPLVVSFSEDEHCEVFLLNKP
jgi:hypothetical protein